MEQAARTDGATWASRERARPTGLRAVVGSELRWRRRAGTSGRASVTTSRNTLACLNEWSGQHERAIRRLYLKWTPCSSRGKLDTNGHAAARHFCLITRTAWRWGRCWRPLAFRGPSGISIESTTRRRTHCRTKRSTYRNSGGARRDGERRGDRTRTKEQRRHAFNFTALVGATSYLPYLCWQIVHIRKFSRTRIYVLFHMGDDGTSCSWWILNFLIFSVWFRLAFSGIWKFTYCRSVTY